MANWKSVMPTMNGYTDEKTDTVVSASSEYDATNSAWKAFDGIYGGGNYWCTKTGENTGWLKVGFNFNRYIIKRYGILSHASFYPVDWNFEGSNDGETWVVLHSVVGGKDGSKWSYYEFDNKKPYRYYRINVTKGASALLYIFEMQLFVDLDDPSIKTLFLVRDEEKVYDDNRQVSTYPPNEDVFEEYGMHSVEELFNEAKQYIFFEEIGNLENGVLYSAKVKGWERIDDIKMEADSNYISFIPTMTSHKHTELEISPTDNYYPCWRAFDKRKDTYFRTRYQGDKEVIYLKFINKKYMIRRYTVYGKPGGRYSRLENIKVEVSNDNKNWMLLHEDKITSEYSIFDINNEELYSYYKITIYRPQSVGVDEIDFFFDELYKGKYYLITVNKCYYTIKDNKLIALSENIVSSDLFKDNGFRDIEDIKKVSFIGNDFEILCYSDEVNICEDIA